MMLCQSAYGQSYRIHHEHTSPCPAAYVNGLQFRTEAEAIAAWNTRAEMSYKDALILLDELGLPERTCEIAPLIIDIAETACGGYDCSVCHRRMVTPGIGLAMAAKTFNYCPSCGAKVVGE